VAEGDAWVTLQRRALAVFESLLALPEDQRLAELEKEHGGEPELLAAVRQLLAEDSADESFLDQPLLVAGEKRGAPSYVGRRIGPYELKELLGEGGAGVVYLAERTEGDFEHKVAVKLIRRHLGTKEAERRVRTERQILASLDHPNIARLLDGGTTDDGVPYVIMEAIDGFSLTEFCDRGSLSLRQRLRLFRTVCESVHYAHSHLVVHRDLKPSNILVTSGGTPKLLDFGIAKLLEASAEEEDHTRTELRALTPAYASPEQLAGRTVTTASDVYSLGVILYELVCGLRPYELGTDTPDQLAVRLERTPPLRPSAALRKTVEETGEELARSRGMSRGELARRLESELDLVVAKAMAPDPDARYASAQQLAEDIGRLLDGLPVIARAPSFGYRLSKMVRRHRWAVGLGTAAMVLIVAFAALAAWKAVQLERERDTALALRAEAERQRQRSAAVTAFLQDSFVLADPGETRGANLTAREVLAAGVARLPGSLGSEPDIRAALLEALADVHVGIGRYDAAGTLAEEAVTLRRGLGSPVELAQSLETLGIARLHEQDFAAARALMAESLALRQRELGPEDPAVASNLFYLASLHHWQGRPEEAEAAARRALDIRQRNPTTPAVELAESWYLLGEVTHQALDPEEVEDYFRRALAAYREAGQGQERKVVLCLHALGEMLAAAGRGEEAGQLLAEAEKEARALLGPDHPVVADILVSRGSWLRGEERWDEAETSLREAVAIYRRAGGDDDDLVVDGLVHLGNLLLEKGDLAAAEPPLREAVERSRRVLDDSDPRRGTVLNNLTVVLLRRGELAEVATLCAEAVPLRRRQLELAESSPESLRAGRAHTLLPCADGMARGGHFAAARTAAEEALATYEAQGPEWRAAAAKSVLGAALAGLGENARGEELLAAGHAKLAEQRPGSAYEREARERLAALYRRTGQLEKLAALGLR
jgi:serine/threonine protein kinase/tetratricopeptide (TPR) repeat protein